MCLTSIIYVLTSKRFIPLLPNAVCLSRLSAKTALSAPSFTATAPIEARSRSVSTQTPRPVVFDVESSSSPCTAVMPRFHNTLARIKSRLDDSLLLISRDHPDVDLSYLREVFATMVINHEGRTCRLYELPC